MANRLMVLAATLAVSLAAAVPALGQEEPQQPAGENDFAAGTSFPDNGGPDGGSGYGDSDGVGTDGDSIDNFVVNFELAVESEPPAEATFFGQTPLVGGSVQLTDPDGDGLYNGSLSGRAAVQNGVTTEAAPVQIVQGIGTSPSGTRPDPAGGAPTVIRDFGWVKGIENGQTFSASVSFPDNGDSDSGDSGGGGSDNGGSYNGGSSSGDSGDGSETGGKRVLLPNTGGVVLGGLGAGTLLVAGGLLIRRIFG